MATQCIVDPAPRKEIDAPCTKIDATEPDPQIKGESTNNRKRSLRQRNGIYYGIFDIDMSSDDESESADLYRRRNTRQSNDATTTTTNTGSNRSKREKVGPTWNPDEGCRPLIEDAPVFYPTEQEFEDTLKYIASIRPEAEKYGICRIIPPKSWAPPCPLRETDFWKNTEFSTREQDVNKLQNREPRRKKKLNNRKRKRRKRFQFSSARNRRRNENVSGIDSEKGCNDSDSEEKFGFHSGPDFTLEGFEEYANEFKEKYFRINDNNNNNENNNDDNNNKKEKRSPSLEEIEGEYWRIVEEADEEIEVHYGADLDTSTFGSGFPKASLSNSNSNFGSDDKYVLSGWNLNNLPRLPGSVLSFEKEEISGVLVPWLYVGMCFSSFCWHVEDHHLYSLNYMHFGEPKVWYGVPGIDAVKLEDSMRKNLPHLFEEQPNLLHELVTQLNPSVLKSEGVPVYRAVQKSGEFVLTFPRAYHSGFNCGFNCAEAVNVAPADWLLHGQCAVELYREQQRKTSISHDKLLLGTARDAVGDILGMRIRDVVGDIGGMYQWRNDCGKNGVLTEAIKARIEMERKARVSLGYPSSRLERMDKSYDSSSERECFSCFYDLHLSAVRCECSPDRFACLSHASLLCSCELEKRSVLVRFAMAELDTLVRALEGDLEAAEQWRSLDPDFHRENSRKYDQSRPDLNTNELILVKSERQDRAESSSESGQGYICKSSPKLFGVDLERGQCSQNSLTLTLKSQSSQRPEFFVEPIEFGVVLQGKSWSSKQAIFPKGFKSRVKFISVLDPTKTCNYISEIVDAGFIGPLFKVTMEECPDVSFTHSSPVQCWDLVRERINKEIINLQKTGKSNLPPLQSLESLNGFEMFGFSSPHIIQVLETLDSNHQSLEFWSSKSKDLFTKDPNLFGNNISPQKLLGFDLTNKGEANLDVNTNFSLLDETKFDQSTLRALFNKANIEELKVMRKIFSNGPMSKSWKLALDTLDSVLLDQIRGNADK